MKVIDHARGLLLLALMSLSSGCVEMLYSDNQNAQRQHARQMREWLAASQSASRQAAPAKPVIGDALVKLLTGQTHVIEYRRRTGDEMPYRVSYAYFRADGRYVFLDTHSRRNADSSPGDRWRVADDALCIAAMSVGVDEQCYVLKQEAGGAIQYWIHKPGDVSHGLITSNVTIVRSGLQTPMPLPAEPLLR
jgi:hypothetical protein